MVADGSFVLKEQLPVQPYLGIKMDGSDSHFNISLTVKGKVTRQGPKTTTFDGTGELKWAIKSTLFAYQPNAFPLDQTDSSSKSFWWWQRRVRDSNHLPHPLPGPWSLWLPPWRQLSINPFTAPASQISSLKSACTGLQTVYFPILSQICCR